MCAWSKRNFSFSCITSTQNYFQQSLSLIMNVMPNINIFQIVRWYKLLYIHTSLLILIGRHSPVNSQCSEAVASFPTNIMNYSTVLTKTKTIGRWWRSHLKAMFFLSSVICLVLLCPVIDSFVPSARYIEHYVKGLTNNVKACFTRVMQAETPAQTPFTGRQTKWCRYTWVRFSISWLSSWRM